MQKKGRTFGKEEREEDGDNRNRKIPAETKSHVKNTKALQSGTKGSTCPKKLP